MNKTIYLGVTQFIKEHEEFIDVNLIYKEIPKFLKPLRKIFFDFDLPLKKIWLVKGFKNTVEQYDTIILSANQYSFRIAKIIDSYNFRNKRLIFWYWNPVDRVGSPRSLSSAWEKWSFDKRDCEKYQLKYNNTYYFKKFISNTEGNGIEYDVSFVGQDKGRLPLLLDIEKQLKRSGISLYYHVVKDKTSYLAYDYKERINYNRILGILKLSKVLLDIVQEGQSGLTLRIMEGLFFSKKIITNNCDVVKYDFYDSNNIFIWGIDPEEKLVDFIKADYSPISQEVLEAYTVNNWLNNFDRI
ncbi:hypothetical protein [Sphingobacterium multivorum]|uniref:hypothetical protein n=1 Tax=Sphingobacterium multivorum TaxID=28454 RepID=UPI0028B125BB|nr:hypothetical protein [Sphingobacterium multivorum]